MVLFTVKVSKGDLDGGSGLGKAIQRWDAKQAASGLLIFMPDLFCRCDRLSHIQNKWCFGNNDSVILDDTNKTSLRCFFLPHCFGLPELNFQNSISRQIQF